MDRWPLILLAEDDDDDYFLTREALTESGRPHRLERVRHGGELLEWLRRPGAERPAVVLLDLNMPRMDGREALAELRADAALADVPVLIYTTSRNDEDQALCAARGANDFLQKPYSYDELLSLMDAICERWLPVGKPG